MEMGYYSTSFKIGRDVYTYGTFYNNISKFGIDENKNYYSQVLVVDSLTFACGFCFSFVMSDDSVLTSTGYDTSDDPGGYTSNKMGFFYLNPIEKTITKPSGYKTLPGTPNQRVYHQAVMPPDKKSVYIFGGLDVEQANISSASILQFDITSSTFTTHGNFTFIGGAATMLP
jgi:hypothetical protein